MNAHPLELPLGLPAWRQRAAPDVRDWLAVYREAEAEVELAAAAVRAACEAYKAEPNPAHRNVAAYREADRAYDAARSAFQRTSYQLVNGVRAIAGIARHFELAEIEGRSRML